MRVPTDLAPVVARVRDGDISALQEDERKAMEAWLAETLVKGRTTMEGVIGVFGKRFHDLDRPERDAIVSIQYSVGSYGDQTQLQFDFHAKTGVVTDWSWGHAICGFCPHVFAGDQRWRLEGKMLAGCVGKSQEGHDVLLLPRLQAYDERLHVKLSNLAAEWDYIDHVQLAAVSVGRGEELDIGLDGELFIWRPENELHDRMKLTAAGRGELSLRLNPAAESRVVVLEVRNTTAFETAMRDFVFGKSKAPPNAAMQAHFDGRAGVQIEPVGTKFYRRIVLPVPEGSRSCRLEIPHALWVVRRVWIGTGGTADADVRWQSPEEVTGSASHITALLSRRDGQRACLQPMQEAELRFVPPEPPADGRQWRYALSMAGYYDFFGTAEGR